MISLGILGLLHALFLPGLLIALWGSRGQQIAWQEKFLFATPLSILINYLSIALLTWLNLYSRGVMLSIIALECALILIYLKQHLSATEKRIAIPRPIVIPWDYTLLQRVLQCAALLPLLILYFLNCWSVFEEWDAVVSWNRWAKEWFHQAPGPSIGYPPGLPLLYSIVYKLTGTLNVQTLAKNVAAYFPFFGLFCLWRIGSVDTRYRWTSLLAGIFYVFLIQRGYGTREFIFSGYTDPLIASLAAFGMYALVLLRKHVRNNETVPNIGLLPLIILCALIAPAIIKQNGAMLAVVNVGCAMLILRHQAWKHRWLTLGLLVLGAIGIAHWYIYSYFRWNDYSIASSLLDPNVSGRLLNALKLTVKVTSRPLTVVAVASLFLHRKARLLTCAFLLPLWMFWGVLVSYDFRSAYFLMPGIAWLAAMGSESLATWLYKRYGEQINALATLESISARKLTQALLIGIFITLIFLPMIYSTKKILVSNEKQLIKSNDKGFNREAIDWFAKSGENQKTLSCWQMLYNLPEAEGKFIPYSDCNNGYREWLTKTDIKYLVYWEKEATPPHNADEVRTEAAKAGVTFKERRLAEGFILFEKHNHD